MTPERWNRLKNLVGDALERPAAERAAFLAGACRDDDALRAEAEALLAAEREDDLVSPLDDLRVPEAEREPEREPEPEVAPGRRIGPYRVVRLLGQGGMGAVYEVERADGHFRLRGALKLVRPGLDGPTLRERFAQERQILASLNHPHIARLLDGGVTEGADDDPHAGGQPYLVMEYVEGEPLLAFCDARRLPTETRLRLFLQVCDAVQFAHRNLVVHRDLKPSNILVAEEDGVAHVKLLDFGIAKLMDDAPGASPLTRTAFGLFTPEYAAPEQVSGGRVTTATDVYQLGAILYELLAGRRPFDLAGLTPAAIERWIATAEPRRPSVAVQAPPTRPAGAPRAPASDAAPALDAAAIGERRSTPPDRLRRRLDGDLDVIVLKALRKEPEGRYASAEGLADDLRRHLDGRPVVARRATLGYRAAKLVRRYRTLAAAAAVLLAVSVGLTVYYTVQVRTERDRAESALLEAQTALGFLQQMIWSAGPEDGDPTTPIGVVLDSAAARIEPDLADQPGVASTLHAAVGYAYMSLGRLDAAERHTRRALALREGEPDTNRVALLSNLAVIRADQGDFEGALPYHVEAVALSRTLDGGAPTLAAALNGHASTLIEIGRYDEAEALLDEALPLYRRSGDPSATLPALNNVVIILQYQGRHEEAVPRMREIVARMRDVHGPDHYQIGVALANLAGSLSVLGRSDEATAAFEEALGVFARTVEPSHPNRLLTRISLAEHRKELGDFDTARAEMDDVLTVAEETYGEQHPVTAYALNVAGAIDCGAGAYASGEARLRRSYAVRRALYPEGHWLAANSGSLLGDCLVGLGRYAEAEPLLVDGYRAIAAGLGEDHEHAHAARERMEALYDAWDGGTLVRSGPPR